MKENLLMRLNQLLKTMYYNENSYLIILIGGNIMEKIISLDGYMVDKDGKFDWITGDGDKTLDTI